MMAPTFKSVVMLLASLQLTHQASLSRDFYNNKDVLSPFSNKLAYKSSFNVPSVIKSKESDKYEPVKDGEFIMLNIDRGSDNFRAKRQVNQDSDLDAEIISNDPEMFSYGKSMPMTTEDNDDTHKLQHDTLEDTSLDKDVESETSNLLGELSDNAKEANETSKEEEKIETQANTFVGKLVDASTTNDAPTPKTTDEETLDHILSPVAQKNDSEIHIVPTINYEVPVSKESSSEKESKIASMETSAIQPHGDSHVNKYNDNNNDSNVMSDGEHGTSNPEDQDYDIEEDLYDEKNDKGKSLQNANEETENIVKSEDKVPVSTNEMKEHPAEVTHSDKHSNEVTVASEVTSTTVDSLTNSNNIDKHNGKEEVVPKEVFVSDNEAEFDEYLDKDDVEVLNHVHPVSSDSESSQLRTSDNVTIDTDEGSGDTEGDVTGSHETFDLDDAKDSNSSNNNDVLQSIPRKTNDMDINIDLDSVTENINKEVEKENEDESPISDPTQGVSNVDDKPKTSILREEKKDGEENEELPLPEPTESSANDDLSQTYDPRKSIDLFGIDGQSEIFRSIGKALGINNNFETTTENEELEGSGLSIVNDNESDKGSLEEDALFKVIDPRMLHVSESVEIVGETTTSKQEADEEEEVSELPMVTDNRAVLYNPPVISSYDDDSVSTETTKVVSTQPEDTRENESTLIPVTEIPFISVVDTSNTFKEHGERISDPSDSAENGNGLPVKNGINEVGLMNDRINKADDVPNTSSSSTGSFIVLGAIMATIVLLLGYSVIKSRRQKQRNLRIPPDDDQQGTELKERHTLLPEKNGHGPGNGLNIESGKLLNSNEESEKDDLKGDDSYPKTKSVNEVNEVSEVKVNKENAASPNNLDNVSQHVGNGVGLKNSSPNHSRQLNEPSSPSTDDKMSLVHGTKPEVTKAKIIIDHDSIPKTPVLYERTSKFENVTY